MTGKDILVYCPYCGVLNSEEHQLINLLRNEVFILACRECEKTSTLILYELENNSSEEVQKINKMDNSC